MRPPLIERKQLLAELLGGASDRVRFSNHFEEEGGLVLQHACRLSLEGIVSKLSDAPYRSGRNKNWVKSKCSSRQEFVIGGFVPSTTANKAIGSLVLGAYDDGKFCHVGRVGTGYTATVATDLYRRLEPTRTTASPFTERLSSEEARQVRYVRPDLVAEVEFRAWTADGHLRHASFRGLREDKPASAVTLEVSKSPSPRRSRRAAPCPSPTPIGSIGLTRA